MLKIPVQIADRTLPRVYVSVYDEQALVDNKLAALIDDRRTAPRDVYDLDVLLVCGVAPSAEAVESLGGKVTLMKRVADKLDLMSWLVVAHPYGKNLERANVSLAPVGPKPWKAKYPLESGHIEKCDEALPRGDKATSYGRNARAKLNATA